MGSAGVHQLARNGHPPGHEPAAAARRLQRLRVRPSARRSGAPRGRGLGEASPPRSRSARRPRRRSDARRPRRGESGRGFAPTTASGTAWTRSSSTPPGITCSTSRSTQVPFAAAGAAPAGRARPRGAAPSASPRRRRYRLPALGHVLGDPGPSPPAGGRRGVGAAFSVLGLRPPQRAGDGQARGPRGNGNDREAGRLRRAREHDAGGPRCRRWSRRGVRADRPQAVLPVPIATRSLSWPRPPAGSLLPVPALDTGRRAQPLPAATSQGQARKSRERLLRGRVRLGLARLVGDEGAGVRTIIEMVNDTRLDCASAAPPACGQESSRHSTMPHTGRPSGSCRRVIR